MLQRIIDFSLRNKFLVLLATVALGFGGVYAARHIPLDAIPDLSDTQVIIYTPWEDQAPNLVEDQVTYPITTKMLSVPKAKVVRGYSFYGFSFVYVIFEDGTDPYWARSRVLEYLSSIGSQLPKGVTPSLGPDATGVGWAFMYSLNSTNRDLAELRSLQDWYLKYQLTAVPGVSEVASVGGFVRQYQVTVDPTKLRAYNLALKDVSTAIERSNGEVGGRSLELAEREFILRVKGYITSLDDLKKIAVGIGDKGVPILLRDVATLQFGPDMRRGIAEANGRGETVGGIVVVRYGANAYQVIQDVKARLATAMKALPDDVKVTVNYDRSELIDRAVKTLEEKLVEDRGEYEVVQDFAGRHVLCFKGRRSGFMPEYIDHPVKDMQTWKDLCKWRLDPKTPERYAKFDETMAKARAAAGQGMMMVQGLVGGYMYLRSLVGPEALLYKFYDDPALIHDCMQTWFDLADAVIARHQQHVTFDELFIGEDICYNRGPLISPEMIREFLFPYYSKLIANMRRRQIDQKRHLFFQVDTDGEAVSVIPLFQEIGMDVMSPFEVASGCDVVAVGKQYPDLIIYGGVDKRELARGRKAIDALVDRIFPAMKKRGGYIPTCDHGVPTEVKYQDYLYYRQRCLEFA